MGQAHIFLLHVAELLESLLGSLAKLGWSLNGRKPKEGWFCNLDDLLRGEKLAKTPVRRIFADVGELLAEFILGPLGLIWLWAVMPFLPVVVAKPSLEVLEILVDSLAVGRFVDSRAHSWSASRGCFSVTASGAPITTCRD